MGRQEPEKERERGRNEKELKGLHIRQRGERSPPEQAEPRETSHKPPEKREARDAAEVARRSERHPFCPTPRAKDQASDPGLFPPPPAPRPLGAGS